MREELRSACPFTEPSVEAFQWSMPVELLLLAKQSKGLINPQRLWTTFLCRSFLRGKNEHFLVEVGGAGGADTIPAVKTGVALRTSPH